MAAIVPESSAVTSRREKARRYLRLFLHDTPELNRLIRRKESEEVFLDFAIDMAISDWNATTPLLRPVTIDNFPSLSMLMHGATIQVLISQGIVQARNELSYNAGGSSFVRSNKSNYYMQWAINLQNQYELKKRNIKIQQNVNRGWGTVSSEYDRVGYTW